MILEVQHETVLDYTDPVMESTAELRMEPLSDGDQSCSSFHLAVAPNAPLYRYTDGFGNHVHHYTLMQSHLQTRMLAASVVETHPRRIHLEDSRSTMDQSLVHAPLETFGFLQLRGPARSTSLLEPVLDALRPSQSDRVIDFVLRVSDYIKSHYTYAMDVTAASSPIDDVLQMGKGVCQDFAHLMIAVLRSYSVPARYASGYIHRPNQESQSHAWCEAWIPDVGWIGVDPTNNQTVDEFFVKVAVGRDFTDVSPNRGIFRGQGSETISVRVATRSLERLPTRSWQDQLPALDLPLTKVLQSRNRFETQSEEQADQQQQ
jgi:transglutaminase-like putative cysteine protease